MTISKKTTKPKQESAQEKKDIELTELTKEAFIDGRLQGQQDVYRTFANFLKNRMVNYYENKEDVLAKELRYLYLTTLENIKE
jgi:CRISPR/Cas system Type II protein with McrA/HNH and RuvC-like nuclease domain|tara:strand:+ start:273 stop:521 length:249 start_codon:yes stop_codon:yes gene_type:complete